MGKGSLAVARIGDPLTDAIISKLGCKEQIKSISISMDAHEPIVVTVEFWLDSSAAGALAVNQYKLVLRNETRDPL